jgi:hypothetical protein
LTLFGKWVTQALYNPLSVGRNGAHLLSRMSLVNNSIRVNTPLAIGTLLIAGCGLEVKNKIPVIFIRS